MDLQERAWICRSKEDTEITIQKIMDAVVE